MKNDLENEVNKKR